MLWLRIKEREVLGVDEKKIKGRAKIDNSEITPHQFIESVPSNIVWVQHDFWKKILWNDNKNEMIMGNAKLVELLFIYVYKRVC